MAKTLIIENDHGLNIQVEAAPGSYHGYDMTPDGNPVKGEQKGDNQRVYYLIGNNGDDALVTLSFRQRPEWGDKDDNTDMGDMTRRIGLGCNAVLEVESKDGKIKGKVRVNLI